MLENVSKSRLLYVICISGKLSLLHNQNQNGYKAAWSRPRPATDIGNILDFLDTGGQLPVETRYTCAPRVIGKIKKTLPWL